MRTITAVRSDNGQHITTRDQLAPVMKDGPMWGSGGRRRRRRRRRRKKRVEVHQEREDEGRRGGEREEGVRDRRGALGETISHTIH